jgi:hypothetical protein
MRANRLNNLVTNENKFLLRNLGIGEEIFEIFDNYKPAYALQKNKIRKVFSDGAVQKIFPDENVYCKNFREEEDAEIYREIYSEEGGDDPFRDEPKSDLFVKGQEQNYEQGSHIESEEISNIDLFKNCSNCQINKLKRLVSEINSPEEKVIVKAYKSKLKSKFFQIYEVNSKEFKEKIKHKIFHKCSFPSCGRTFASAGWLKSHFNEHLKELKKNKFNILFENFLNNYKNYLK